MRQRVERLKALEAERAELLKQVTGGDSGREATRGESLGGSARTKALTTEALVKPQLRELLNITYEQFKAAAADFASPSGKVAQLTAKNGTSWRTEIEARLYKEKVWHLVFAL